MPRDTSGDWKEKFRKSFEDDSEGNVRYVYGEAPFANRKADIDDIESFIESLLSSQKELWLGRAREEIGKLKIMRKKVTDQGIVIMVEQGCKRNTALNEVSSALSSLSEGEE